MNVDKTIYERVSPLDAVHGPHLWIQWKGTDVCCDMHCQCGFNGHFDGDFLYYFECPACKIRYAVGMNVKLYPLTFMEAALIESDGRLKTCDLEDDG